MNASAGPETAEYVSGNIVQGSKYIFHNSNVDTDQAQKLWLRSVNSLVKVIYNGAVMLSVEVC